MKKILIIRFSSIGDIVLTSPVIRCLKIQLREVEVHYLTKKAFVPILESNPYVDKVFWIDKKERLLKNVVQELKIEDYDIIIDLHNNLRSWYVRLSLRVKTMVFNKLNYKKWLLTKLKIDRMPNVHIVERYLDTVKSLDVCNDNKGLEYFIPTSDYIPIEEVDSRLKRENFIVFVIGGAHETKRMPASKLKAICSELTHEFIVLIGSKGEEEMAMILEEAGEHVINLCSRYNLHESASIVDQAKLVVAHDTGFMHIAAGLKRPIISIWGNTVPKFGMYPYLPEGAPKHQIIENNDLDCRPCSKLGHNRCPKGHFKCMVDIDNQIIIETIRRSVRD